MTMMTKMMTMTKVKMMLSTKHKNYDLRMITMTVMAKKMMWMVMSRGGEYEAPPPQYSISHLRDIDDDDDELMRITMTG